MQLRLTLPAAAALLLSPSVQADKIYRVDGTTVSNVTITAETLEGVNYKDEKRKEGSVPADLVLSVEFSSKPQLVDSADAAIAEEAYGDAQVDLLNFLEGMEQAPRKHPWSRAYALYRLIEVCEVLGESAQVARFADQLAEVEGNSRYLPFAQLKKAQALFDSGDSAGSISSLTDLQSTIDGKGLGDRWRTEHELAKVLFDANLKGASRMSKLEGLVSKSVGYATVNNRAKVALGESMLLAGQIKEAEKVFRDVVSDPKGDGRTLAGAYSGLGDALFAQGEPNKDSDVGQNQLREARVAFMRVVVSYKNQLAYVPKAMFYAGRCFQLLADDEFADEKADKLYKKLIRTFDGTRWANEARAFRPK